jgi:5-bromo-4-chloroindolyl phosphate hydrolysis protein
MNQRSGSISIFGLLCLVVIFVILRNFFPSFAKLLLIFGGIAAAGVAVLIALVLYFAFRKPKKTTEQQIAENAAVILRNGRTQLMEIRRLTVKIKSPELRKTGESICSVVDKILRTLKEQPKDIPGVGRVFHYYLPTLQSILTKYLRLESNGIPADDITEKTISCLHEMETAMEKQYQNLFENDKLDLSVEMTVLAQICRRDGLLEDGYTIPEIPSAESEPHTEEGITLTL